MTTERFTRCSQCGVEYTFFLSGGPPEGHGSSRFCPSCAEVVQKALATIPRVFEQRFQSVAEIPRLDKVSLEMVLEWERQADEENRGKLVGKRIFSPLFDLDTGDSTNSRGVWGQGPYRGIMFRVTTWKKKPDYEIAVAREWDCAKQSWTGHAW